LNQQYEFSDRNGQPLPVANSIVEMAVLVIKIKFCAFKQCIELHCYNLNGYLICLLLERDFH